MSEYTLDDFLRRQDNKKNAANAVAKDPEKTATVYNLSQEKRLPFDYVERNQEKVEKPVPQQEPFVLEKFLQDRNKASIAMDDLENLRWWEKEAKNMGGILASSGFSVSSSLYSMLSFASDVAVTPLERMVHTLQGTESEKTLGDRIRAIAADQRVGAERYFPTDSVLHPAVLGGIKSAVINIPPLLAAAATRNPNLALGTMGGFTYGESYLTAKEAGLDTFTSALYASSDTIAEVVTERIPAFKLIEDLGVGKSFPQMLATQMAAEIPGEQLATAWQDLNEWAFINKDKTIKDYLKERPDAAVETLISTIVATGLQTSVAAGVDRAVNGFAEKAQESKVNLRSPKLFEEHLQEIMESYGAQDEVYIDASEARTLFQDLEQDAAYDLIAEQIDEAEAVGGDIVISVGQFASTVATSPNYEKLKDYIRLSTDTTGAVDSVTDVSSLLSEAASAVESRQRANEIFTQVQEQLVATGRLTPQQAKASAAIIPAYVTTKAARSGLSVDEVYQMMGLEIVGPQADVLEQAKQSGYEGTDQVEANEWQQAVQKFGPEGMTTEARMARAKEMGFDTDTVYYHGTFEAFEAFDKEQLGAGTFGNAGDPAYGATSFVGFWHNSGEIKDAKNSPYSLYQENYIKTENPLRFDSLNDLAEELRGVIPPEFEDSDEVRDSVNSWVEKKTDEGYDSIIIQDEEFGGESIAVFSPKNIRSINAAFDPDFKDSPNLLAQSESEFFKEQGLLTDEEAATLSNYEDTRTVGEGIPGEQRPQAAPIPVFRGAAQPLAEADFQALGAATGHPSAALGVFFTSDQADAAIYGDVEQHTLSLENPKSFSVADDIPAFDSPEEYTQFKDQLIREGYDGIVFDYSEVDGPTHYVAFEVGQVGRQLKQDDKKGPRGTISILPDSLIIQLTEASNLSTFLHESGHAFLEMEGKFYGHPNASPEMKADGETILSWLGAESFDTITTEQHEHFARGFEKYLGEGKAPSVELQSVFRRFSAWLKQVYRNLANLNVDLNDDVRGVMDRMLATDEAISRVKGDFNPIFENAEDAGATQAEFDSYTRRATPDTAKEELQAKLLKQLQRQHKQWWADEKAPIVARIKKALIESPLYAAIESGQKLDRATVKALLGVDRLPNKFKGLTEKNGLSPDDLAAQYDLASGQELVQRINDELTLNQEADRLAQQEMIERHGDALNDGTLEEEAEQASRNVEHGKKILAEIRFLARKAKAPAIDRAAIAEYARDVIQKMAWKKIRPSRYRNAEVRAARAAAIAKREGRLDDALRFKQQELMNFYLAREAQRARDKADSQRRYLAKAAKRQYSPKEVAADYGTRINLLASLYDFRKSKGDNNRAVGLLQSIADWIVAQEGNPESHVYPAILDMNMSMVLEASENGTLASIEITPYQEMTPAEIDAVYEQVKHLRYIGGQLSETSRAAFREKTKSTGQSIRDNAGKVITVPEEKGTWHRITSMLREFGEDHLRLANQVEEMDGWERFGPLFTEVYQKIVDSSNTELAYRRKMMSKLQEAFKAFTGADLKEGKGEVTINLKNGRQWTLSRRARIMLALYWGSPEGREGIRLGHDVTDSDVQQMLNTMEARDVDLVEQVWKINESFWPEVSRINQSLKGVTLPKVEHVPFKINGRQLPGGYMRLFYAHAAKDSAREAKDSDELSTRTGKRLTQQTRHGSRNARVGSGGRKMSWELNNIFQALDETLHDVSFAETAGFVNRFMRSSDIRDAIYDHYGKEKYESILSAISGVVAGNIQNNHYINSFMRRFRTAQTYAFLGYSIRNVVQQPVALTNMFGKLGEVNVINAMIEFYSRPIDMRNFVWEKSEFMRDRTSVVNRDSAEIMNQFKGAIGGPWNKFKQYAFWLQTAGDAAVAYPGWLAAYRDGLKKFGDEKKAITHADEMVSATIGSGLIKDQSPLLQGGGLASQAAGPEMIKALTFMGSYFNVILNLSRDAVKTADFRSATGVAEFSRQMAWYLFIPAIISALIVGDTPDEDDDEGWAEWSAKTVSSYGASQVFVVRDIASMLNGFGPSSSYERASKAIYRAGGIGVDVIQGDKELDLETSAKLIRSLGNFMTLPGSGQAARTMEYMGSDEEFNPYKGLVKGIDR